MILYIDSTDFNKVVYSLADGKKIIRKSFNVDSHKSHEMLQKLGEFLKGFKTKDLRLKKIIVNKGPGSYTGVRVGVSHAMALGFAWGIPVVALPKEKYRI
jgi:tRNA threonylcarbamoyladenosine biosynthesis protein TsaB